MIASQLYYTPVPLRSSKGNCPSAKHQILIVLAERIERDELAGHLRNMADVSFAKNDQEAMNILETRPVQLVISSGSDGERRLCRFIKTSVWYSHIPIIELIPRDSFTIRLQCLESGVDAWLEKPVSRHILLAQVNNLLANRARVTEHFTRSNPADASVILPSVGPDEELWQRLNQVISQHLSNTDLDIDLLARHLFMSRPTLYRKIAEMSQLSPSELITLIRLKHAAALLAAPNHPIGDIARIVGFTTRSGFGKAFLKQYHMSPSAYRQNHPGQDVQDDRRAGMLSSI